MTNIAFASLSVSKIADNLDLLFAIDNTRRSDTLNPEMLPMLDQVSEIAGDRFSVALNYAAYELGDESLITRAAHLAKNRQHERVMKLDRRRQMKALDAEIARMSAELNGTAFAY